MENDIPNGPKTKPEPLPESTTTFWEYAEVHTNLIPHTEWSEDGHFFVRIPGNQAECIKCHWGFVLDAGDKIKDGHLYDKKGNRVI